MLILKRLPGPVPPVTWHAHQSPFDNLLVDRRALYHVAEFYEGQDMEVLFGPEKRVLPDMIWLDVTTAAGLYSY